MDYTFKPAPELVWAIIVTVATVLAQAIGDGKLPTDLTQWAIGVAVGMARALLGLILSFKTGGSNAAS